MLAAAGAAVSSAVVPEGGGVGGGGKGEKSRREQAEHGLHFLGAAAPAPLAAPLIFIFSCCQDCFVQLCSFFFSFFFSTLSLFPSSQAGDKHYHPSCARCSRCNQMFTEGEEMYLQGRRTGPPLHRNLSPRCHWLLSVEPRHSGLPGGARVADVSAFACIIFCLFFFFYKIFVCF